MRIGPRLLRTVAVVTLVTAWTITIVGPVRGATPNAHEASPSSPNPSPRFNILYGVSADSGTDAWAVGEFLNTRNSTYDTLVLHWDGTAWSKVASPNPGVDNVLTGVSADSETDAWAVGSYFTKAANTTDTLLIHWNGVSWLQVASPDPAADNELQGVSADSSTDAVAVGYDFPPPSGHARTLVAHWDGSSWSSVKSPSPVSSGVFLRAVSAYSSTDAVAVGEYFNDATNSYDTLTLHWDGSVWSTVPSPNPSAGDNYLFSVSATSGTSAWAVGYDRSHGRRTLVLHWNGTAWSVVASPNPTRECFLQAVSADSDVDAWAAGYFLRTDSSNKTLILHWDGTSWSRTHSPSPRRLNFLQLSGVSADSATDAWAVGFGQTSDGNDKTVILHWNGTSWSRV